MTRRRPRRRRPRRRVTPRTLPLTLTAIWEMTARGWTPPQRQARCRPTLKQARTRLQHQRRQSRPSPSLRHGAAVPDQKL